VCARADDERSSLACSTAHCGKEGPRRARPSRHAASPRYGCVGLAGFEDGTPECSAPGTSASAGGGAAGRPVSPGARRDASGELSGMAPLAGYLDGESGWMCGRVFLCVKFQLVQPVTRALRYPAAQPPSGMTV